MYAAVYHFGPRWTTDTSVRLLRTEDDFLRIRKYIEDNPQVMLETIEGFSARALEKIYPVITPQMRRPLAGAGSS